MKKAVVSLMSALSIFGMAAPATAAPVPASACSVAGDTNRTRIHDLVVWYEYVHSVGCVVSDFYADSWDKSIITSGYWQLWGPRGWASEEDSYHRFNSHVYRTYPRKTTYKGDLWCARFVKAGGGVLTEGCVTANP
ncbi:hypothetical protein [Amycolatopsis pittospori]|uniref:hypothetical protein n=1 Tax=Amycolatopsis pittospori TaxID=2749434 RepID=UPI0015F09CA2|nr:hypothetical protein [Amycolatopsis pittospori]